MNLRYCCKSEKLLPVFFSLRNQTGGSQLYRHPLTTMAERRMWKAEHRRYLKTCVVLPILGALPGDSYMYMYDPIGLAVFGHSIRWYRFSFIRTVTFGCCAFLCLAYCEHFHGGKKTTKQCKTWFSSWRRVFGQTIVIVPWSVRSRYHARKWGWKCLFQVNHVSSHGRPSDFMCNEALSVPVLYNWYLTYLL